MHDPTPGIRGGAQFHADLAVGIVDLAAATGTAERAVAAIEHGALYPADLERRLVGAGQQPLVRQRPVDPRARLHAGAGALGQRRIVLPDVGVDQRTPHVRQRAQGDGYRAGREVHRAGAFPGQFAVALVADLLPFAQGEERDHQGARLGRRFGQRQGVDEAAVAQFDRDLPGHRFARRRGGRLVGGARCPAPAAAGGRHLDCAALVVDGTAGNPVRTADVAQASLAVVGEHTAAGAQRQRTRRAAGAEERP